MLKFYYTAAGLNINQNKAHLSLGGFRSNLPVANGEFGAFFSDISMMAVKDNVKKYLCLMLVNEGIKIAYDVCFHFVYPENNFLNLQIAVVEPVNVSGEGYYVARVENINAKPLYVEFVPANGVLNKVNLGDIEPGKMIGVWFESSLNLETINNSEDLIYTQEGIDTYRYREVELPTIEDIKLNIDWAWERQLIPRVPQIINTTITTDYIDIQFSHQMIDPSQFINDFKVRLNGVLRGVLGVELVNESAFDTYRITIVDSFVKTDIVNISIAGENICEDLAPEEGYVYHTQLAEVVELEIPNNIPTLVVPSIQVITNTDHFSVVEDMEGFKRTDHLMVMVNPINSGEVEMNYSLDFINSQTGQSYNFNFLSMERMLKIYFTLTYTLSPEVYELEIFIEDFVGNRIDIGIIPPVILPDYDPYSSQTRITLLVAFTSEISYADPQGIVSSPITISIPTFFEP